MVKQFQCKKKAWAKMDCTSQNATFWCFVELKNGSTPLHIHGKHSLVFPDSYPAYSAVKLWCWDSPVTNGKRTRVEDGVKSGRSKSAWMESNVAEVKKLIQVNPNHSMWLLGGWGNCHSDRWANWRHLEKSSNTLRLQMWKKWKLPQCRHLVIFL